MYNIWKQAFHVCVSSHAYQLKLHLPQPLLPPPIPIMGFRQWCDTLRYFKEDLVKLGKNWDFGPRPVVSKPVCTSESKDVTFKHEFLICSPLTHNQILFWELWDRTLKTVPLTSSPGDSDKWLWLKLLLEVILNFFRTLKFHNSGIFSTSQRASWRKM